MEAIVQYTLELGHLSIPIHFTIFHYKKLQTTEQGTGIQVLDEKPAKEHPRMLTRLCFALLVGLE